jgi:hypothetical protein
VPSAEEIQAANFTSDMISSGLFVLNGDQYVPSDTLQQSIAAGEWVYNHQPIQIIQNPTIGEKDGKTVITGSYLINQKLISYSIDQS